MITASSIVMDIVTIFGAFALVWCVSEFKRPMKDVMIIAIIEGSICLGATILATIYIKTDVIFYAAIGTIATITICSLIGFISKDKWYIIMYEALFQSNGFLIAMYVGKTFAHMFNNNIWVEIVFRGLSFAVMVLIYWFYLKKIFRGIANNYNGKAVWFMLSGISIFFTLLFMNIIFIPTPLSQRTDIPMFNRIMLMAILAYTAVFVFSMISFQSIIEREKMKRTIQEDTLKTEYWKARIESQNELMDRVRQTKHDLRHHDNYLAELLNKKEYDKALKYLEEHGATIDQMSMQNYCKNYTVNSILASFISKAEKQGIKVDCKANVPEYLSIDILELASLFANLLENAIEACQKMDNTKERFINILTQCQDNSLRIQVENSCNDGLEFDGEYPVSTKEIKSGVGTKSIGSIALKHNGVFEFTQENGVFTARVVLEVE